MTSDVECVHEWYVLGRGRVRVRVRVIVRVRVRVRVRGRARRRVRARVVRPGWSVEEAIRILTLPLEPQLSPYPYP